MATHSSILGWRIAWTEASSRLLSTQSQRVRHDWMINPFNFKAFQPPIHILWFHLFIHLSIYPLLNHWVSIKHPLMIDTLLHGSQPCGEGACITQWTMSHAVEGHPRQTGHVKSSDKTWSIRGGNGNPLQYSYLQNPMNSIKRQKDMTLEDRAPRSESVQFVTGEEQRAVTNSSRKNEVAGPRWKWHSVLDGSGGESKVPYYKEQFCIRTCNVRSMNQSERMWSMSWQDWTLTS